MAVAKEHFGLDTSYNAMSPVVLHKDYTRQYLDGKVCNDGYRCCLRTRCGAFGSTRDCSQDRFNEQFPVVYLMVDLVHIRHTGICSLDLPHYVVVLLRSITVFKKS